MKGNSTFLSKPAVTLLIHTESFLNDTNALEYFYNANKLDNIKIYFMPVINRTDTNIFTGKYNHFKSNGFNVTSIKFPDISFVLCLHGKCSTDLTESQLDLMTEQSILRGETADDVLDFIVTNSVSTQDVKCSTPIISLSECKEILRIFLVNKKEFLICENTHIDETIYYIYKHKQLFSEFQNFWSATCATGIIDDWADALDNRLNLLTRCIDYCKIECYNDQNNSSAMNLKYHMAYLMLLITGTFDNLAWLINNLYELNLDSSPLKIDLIKREFKNELKIKSDTLYRFLDSSCFDKNVMAIRKLRDRIVHRDFIKTVTESNNNNKTRITRLFLDNKNCDSFLEAGFPKTGITLKLKEESCIDALVLINFIEGVVVNIVNNILKVISKEIYDSEETICLWKLLDFPKEPYVI